MSEWYMVESADDVRVSDDQSGIECYFNQNYAGACYVEIPFEFIPDSPKCKEAMRLLRELADLQNGAPLMRYEAEYNQTFKEVTEFLVKWKG